MALIKCPNCGNQMSDKALCCPACGYENQAAKKKIQNFVLNVETNYPKMTQYVLSVVVLLTKNMKI